MSTKDPWSDFDHGQPVQPAPAERNDFEAFLAPSERRRRGRRGLRILLYVGIPILVMIVLSEVFNVFQGRTASTPSLPRIETPALEAPQFPNEGPVPTALPDEDTNADVLASSPAETVSAPESRLDPADRPEDLDAFIASVIRSLVVVECQISANEIGQGSGFMVNTQALDGQARTVLVTNWHVVQGCVDQDEVTLTLSDGSTIGARVVQADEQEDLAILESSEASIPALQIESNPSQGDWAMAAGNPEGVTGTVGIGVVSSIKPGQILSDASISFGSSGGPLVNNQGAVIGVTSALFSETSSFGISADIDGLCRKILTCER